MADCVIRSGESVDPIDPRLSDTACTIETGVIIRPPPDLTVVAEIPKKIKPQRVSAPVVPVVAPAPVVEGPKTIAQAAAVAHVAVVETEAPIPPAEPSADVNLTIALVGGAAAVAGTAAVGGAMGGFSALQAKVAAMLGTSKGAVAGAAVVTAGTIVAVKAIESKMAKLEKDLEKTKKDIGETSSSADRIDALLDRLGS